MPRARKPKTTRDEWGSITPAYGGSWRLRYQGPDGKRRDGGRFPTKAEAEDARAQLRTSILGGSWRAPRASDSPTLADYSAAWLQRMELSEGLGRATIALYQRQLDRLVLPDVGGIELGLVPVGRLTRETVMAWDLAARAAARASAATHASGANGAAAARRAGHPARAWARATGLSVPKSGRLSVDVVKAWEEAGSPRPKPEAPPSSNGDRQYEQARTALSSVCTAVVEDGYLVEHPVRLRPGTKARRRNRGERRTAPIVSLEQLLKVAVQMPQPYGVAALLTTFAGLRGGEVFALAVRHLRYGPTGVVSHVRVERALVEISGQPMAFGPPKTDAGVREVAVPTQIGRLLTEHIGTLDDDPETLLFRTVTGRMVTRARRSHVITNARKKVDGTSHLTWHGLRHTGLTMAASVPGATVRNIMDRGGHSTARAALIYQHTAANADEQLAIGLGRLLNPRSVLPGVASIS